MVDNAAKAGTLFTEEQKASLRELASLAGLDARQQSLDAIIDLLACGAAPNSIATVLAAICKPTAIGSAARRQQPPTPAQQ
jgi:hypothetical protein